MHLLKWQYQPNERSGSWKGTIVNNVENDDFGHSDLTVSLNTLIFNTLLLFPASPIDVLNFPIL